MVIEHCRDHVAGVSVEQLLLLANEHRSLNVLMDDASWSSYGQVRALLEAAAQLLGGAEKLADIGEHAAIAAGSMPDSTGAMQDLGSPDAIFTQIGAGHNGITPLLETETEQCGAGDWIIRSRFPVGYEAFPELCWFNVGIDRLIPALFGFADIETVEETCLRRGDEWCTVRVTYNDTDSIGRSMSFLESRLQVSNSRLEAFQRTVAELVSADDLDTVLNRVIESAAHAARASAFVLALDPLPWSARSVYFQGLESADAHDVARRVLATAEGSGVDGGIAVDIVSTRRHYGKLIALDRSESIMAHEHGLLEAYARLVATALDSATALEESRRQARTAHALLNLSTALAEIATVEEMAVKLAQAIPLVIDCDRALVLLVDADAGFARIAGSQGFDSRQVIIGTGLPLVAEGWIGELRFHELDHTFGGQRSFMQRCGIRSMVSLPMMVDGTAVGILLAGVTSRPERLELNAELEQRLRGLAAQASTALRNAALVEQIRHQAMHDSLTGLPNRNLLMDRAEQMLARSRRDSTASAALYVDIDGFKNVNDMFGHAAGDQLLCAVAVRLMESMKPGDTLGRLGGDEFILLAEGESISDGADQLAERLLVALREPFHLAAVPSHPIELTASIGIAEGNRMTASEWLRDADLALYRGKTDGRDRHVSFVDEMQTAQIDRLQIQDKLRRAQSAEEFFLLFQPTFQLENRIITGDEALIRWRHPVDGVVMPDTFIPVLEASGMIVDVGRWVLREACRQAARWASIGWPIDMAVNLSARQLDHESLVDDVRDALRTSGLDSRALTLEITETAVMRDPVRSLQILTEIRDLGVRLAIDDFGTGYSSLAYLQQFPIDTIKIDRSFIDRISASDESRALVHTLVQLGKTLGLTTLAEGIETNHQLEFLQNEHCDSGQGYLVARPMTAPDVEALLSRQRAAGLSSGRSACRTDRQRLRHLDGSRSAGG